MSSMKTLPVLAILAALVVVPFALCWGVVLLIPAALLLVPCALVTAIVALSALLIGATSAQHDAAHPHPPVSTRPIYST
jgi:fatty acid desaturase